MRYAGLTDEPQKSKRQHGNPRDFRIIQQFTSEAAARQWVKRMLAQGYEEDAAGNGDEIAGGHSVGYRANECWHIVYRVCETRKQKARQKRGEHSHLAGHQLIFSDR